MTHTPTPWDATIYRDDEQDPYRVEVLTPDVLQNYDRITAAANAQFIATACNAHEELVAALRELVAANNAVCRARMPGVSESPPDYATLYESIHRAQAVLGKIAP